MTVCIYDVFDKDGIKINSILIDDRIVDTYWPGYGAKMLDRGPAPVDPTPVALPGKDPEFGVLLSPKRVVRDPATNRVVGVETVQ